MSRFSSKCDLWDWLGSIAREPNETPYECYRRLNTKLFLYSDHFTFDEKNEIVIEKPSDLVWYYPYTDAIHVYERDGKDIHVLAKPEFRATAGRFYKDALYQELRRVIAEEDPKYV